jgi:hypothetical protein
MRLSALSSLFYPELAMSVGSPIWSARDDEALAAAIGDVILAWGMAEWAQVGMMAAILGIEHNRASTLYYQFSNFRSRTNALNALIVDAPAFEPLSPFVAKFSKLSKTRNEIVHGLYIQEAGTPKIYRARMDVPRESGRRSVATKPNDIRQHAEKVREEAQRFIAEGQKIPAYAAWLRQGRQ